MNLVSDLGNDLAVAFFIKQQHEQKLDKKEVLALMNKVREELREISVNKAETKLQKKEMLTLSR